MLDRSYRARFYALPGIVRGGIETCHDQRTRRHSARWLAADAPEQRKVVMHWPACTPDYRPGDPLFVGRSLNGLVARFGLAEDPGVIERKISESRERSGGPNWRTDVRGTRTSQFWRAIDALRGLDGDSLPQRFAWSNLAKISRAEGNDGTPPSWMWKLQLPSAKALLGMEVEQLQPGIVVCITGDWCREFWPEIFPRAEEREDGPVLCATSYGCSPPWICAARPDRRPPKWTIEQWAQSLNEKAEDMGYRLGAPPRAYR